MSFSGPEVAHAIVEIEPVLNTGAFQVAAEQAAANVDRILNQSAKRTAQRFESTFKNIKDGFTFIGQAIASRLPASVTTAANAISSRLGQAFGSVRGGIDALNSQFGSLFAAVSKGAAGAAIAVGALALIAIKITKSFATTADEFQRVEVAIRAVIDSTNTANGTADQLIARLRAVSAGLGFNSVALLQASQQFLTLGFSVDQTSTVLEEFTKAAARTGASSAQMDRAITGLTQIASKGSLQMEELRRQILGNLPGAISLRRVFEILGERLGVSVTEIQKLQQEGKITAADAIPAITQAMKELNDRVDVFAIRASSLSGIMGILRENFNQIVQTSFKPFIDALLPTLKTFFEQLKSGSGPISQVKKDIEDFGRVMGESLGEVLKTLVPLLPQVFHLFVTLTKALAPLVVETVKVTAALGRLLLPVFQFVAQAIDVLLNKIPILSPILRSITAAFLAGGVFRALETFGRALGSIGGFIGRIATPLSKLLKSLSNIAPTVAKVILSVSLFRNILEKIFDILGAVADKIDGFFARLSQLPVIRSIIGGLQDLDVAIRGAGSAADEAGPKFADAFGLTAIKNRIQDAAELTDVLGGLNDAFTAVIDNQDKLIEAQKNVNDAEKNLIKARGDIVKANEDRVEANNRLTEAHDRLKEATSELTKLEEKRLILINDTARDIRELEDAQDDLAKIGIRLLDIDAERRDVLEKIAELQKPATQEEIATADTKIERAKLALNKAIREENDLLKELNKEQQQGVDLTGLTLDQLRTRLADIRASLAAQRAVKKTAQDEVSIEEKRTDARLNVVEAQQALNELIQKRQELDLRVIQNQTEIAELTRKIQTIDIDRRNILRNQVDAQTALNALRSGETTRAREILTVDDQITRAKREQKTATDEVNKAQQAIKTAQDQIRVAVLDVRNAELEVRNAKNEQRLTNAQILGGEREINAALRERLGINAQLVSQTPDLLAASIQRALPVIFANNAALPFIQNNPAFAKQVADLILNNPNKLRDLFRSLGVSGFAEGGMITSPTMAMMGERFKHEMVLPLTKPDRVWQLLAQNLPRYPGALRAAQEAVGSTTTIPGLAKAVSSGRKVQNRGDGPATFDQIQELINLLKNQKAEVHVEAPINITANTSNEDRLVRRISRQVERNVLDQINRRL